MGKKLLEYISSTAPRMWLNSNYVNGKGAPNPVDGSIITSVLDITGNGFNATSMGCEVKENGLGGNSYLNLDGQGIIFPTKGAGTDGIHGIVPGSWSTLIVTSHHVSVPGHLPFYDAIGGGSLHSGKFSFISGTSPGEDYEQSPIEGYSGGIQSTDFAQGVNPNAMPFKTLRGYYATLVSVSYGGTVIIYYLGINNVNRISWEDFSRSPSNSNNMPSTYASIGIGVNNKLRFYEQAYWRRALNEQECLRVMSYLKTKYSL